MLNASCCRLRMIEPSAILFCLGFWFYGRNLNSHKKTLECEAFGEDQRQTTGLSSE